MNITKLFRYNWEFYRTNQKFRGKPIPTMIWAYKKYCEEWRRWYDCPKTIRSAFRSDYKSLIERRGTNNYIYLKCQWDLYDYDTNTATLSSSYPFYKIEDWVIKEIMERSRGIYSSAMFELEPIDCFPREKDWIATPWECYEDFTGDYGFNADAYIHLRGMDAEHVDWCTFNMTWTWKAVPNLYNEWYRYINWRAELAEHRQE